MRVSNILLLVYFFQNVEKIYTTSATGLCHSIADWTRIPDVSECSKFHVCFNNVNHLFECPNNFHFSRSELRCTPGDCQPNDGEICHDYDVLPISSDCRKFTSCLNGKRQLQVCPHDHYFDIKFKICRRGDKSPENICRCGGYDDHTAFPIADDLTQFYTCVNNTAEHHKCPKSYYYNASINSCLPEVKATSLQDIKKSPEKLPAQLNPCQDHKNDMEIVTFQPSRTDCSAYHVCIFGKSFTKRCQKGYYFDADKKYCRLDIGNICVKVQGTLHWKLSNLLAL